MKMIKISYWLASLLILVTAACNKDEQAVTPAASVMGVSATIMERAAALKVDKEIEDGVTVRQYTYDANGRCIKVNFKDRYTIYSYGVNKVTATTVYNDRTKANLVQIFSINALGLATTCTYTYNNKNYLWEYIYNANKQLTQHTAKSKARNKTTYTTDVTHKYTYNSNGDCTSYIYQLSLTNVWYQYEYDKNRLNTLGNENKGLDWLGKGSVHIPKTFITTTGFYYPDWNSKTEFTYYSWMYDAQGYAIKKVKSGVTTGIDTYTYK